LWQGVNGINNPCPGGYRLPTKAEWEDEIGDWISPDAAGAFASPLKLTLAGYRKPENGILKQMGTHGYYWSSSTITFLSLSYSECLNFDAKTASTGIVGFRANAYSVRCIKP
ncbi:MAG: hypothetical protein GY834_12305, partial [Bacteroidetes bacterium]|nr:hypothetical protein [Bacteroidota bacterium]